MSLEQIMAEKLEKIANEAVEKALSKVQTYPSGWPPIMKPIQVFNILSESGFKVCKETVYAWFELNNFPAVQVSDSRKIVGAQALWDWFNKTDNGNLYLL